MTLFDKEMDEHLMAGLEEVCVPGQIMPSRDPWSLRPSLIFTVFGKAKSAGSKRAFVHPASGRAIVTEQVNNKSWKQEVATAGALARIRAPWGDELLLGAVAVEFTFYRPRPKGHYGTGRNAAVVKDSAPPAPTTKPDALKLARAVEDALTSILWKDDAQIVDERLRKVWGEPERCEIVVRPW
jgi:Holliday junction resolvase RusA-like endonuclease